ncbi:MAG: hypothetical protein ABIH08_06150 [Candidatus Omnitrophota bacterium]
MLKIIEKISRKTNKDSSLWYQDKVLELAGFLLKEVKKENIPVKNTKPFEPCKLEVAVR